MRIFKINTVNVLSFPYDYLNIFSTFSLAYFIIRIQYIIHVTYKICVDFILRVRLQVYSGIVVVKVLWSQKLCMDFQLHEGSAPLNAMFFKSQL